MLAALLPQRERGECDDADDQPADARGMVLFGAAGFADHELDLAMGSLMSYVLGCAGAEVATREMARKSGSTEREWVADMFEQASAVAAEYPSMQESVRRRTATDLDTSLTENFVYGLDALLDGLAARVKK